jgi:hypothetical protein
MGEEITKNYAQQYLDENPDVKAEFERFNSINPKKWTPQNYVAYHYYNYGAGEERGGHSFKETTDKLAKQILAQGTSGQWKGQGHGSAEANARDMGKILASAGITDIKDFGLIDQATDVGVTPVYEQKLMNDPEYGDYMGNVIVGYTGPDGKPVDPSLVTTNYEVEGGASYVAPVGKSQTYGNKVTGQTLVDSYGERQTGNAFGGTFAGKGNTGYRVQFDAKGDPIFYTTGASSNDLVTLLDDPVFGALAQAGASYFGGPLGTAALNAAMGKDIKDIAKAAALSYVGGKVAGTVSGNLVDTLGQTGANIAGSVARSAVTGGDPVQALITGGIGAAVPEITSMIPDFDKLGSATQKAINQAVSSALATKGDLSPEMLVRAGLTAAKDYLPSGKPNSKDFIEGYFAPGGESYIAPPTYAPDTKGYFDEITGNFVPNEGGALTFGQLTNETSGTNIDSMKDYKYNPDTGNWTLPDGTEIDTSYMQNSKMPLTGQQVLNNAGAGGPKTPGKPSTPQKPGAPTKPGAGVDINQLTSLLGGGQQAAPTVVLSGQDNSADVQLMEDIFGTTMSAPPAGDPVTRARELARLLRS